jgi:hypothetical protein
VERQEFAGPGGAPIQVKLYDFNPGELPKPAA